MYSQRRQGPKRPRVEFETAKQQMLMSGQACDIIRQEHKRDTAIIKTAGRSRAATPTHRPHRSGCARPARCRRAQRRTARNAWTCAPLPAMRLQEHAAQASPPWLSCAPARCCCKCHGMDRILVQKTQAGERLIICHTRACAYLRNGDACALDASLRKPADGDELRHLRQQAVWEAAGRF